MQNCLDVYGAAKTKLQQQLGEQNIEDFRMTTGGRLVVGFVNTDREQARIKQNISNVTAESQGQGIIGVAENVDISASLVSLLY